MNQPPASPPPPPPGPSTATPGRPDVQRWWHLPSGRGVWQKAQWPSTQAIIALVLGILGVLCCAPVAPVAWYIGSNEERAGREERAAAAGPGRPLGPIIGGGVPMLGKALGIIGTVMLVLELLFGLIWMLFFGGMAVLQGISNR